jgi:flagellar basal-body rod protein FlgC
MINAIQNALSGLAASSKRVEAASSNIANLQTEGSLETGEKAPYSALTVEQSSDGNGGVKANVIPKTTPFVPAYSPDSPFANSDGLVGVPNIDLAEEAVNLKLAEHTFKANLKTIEAASQMSDELLNIFDKRV